MTQDLISRQLLIRTCSSDNSVISFLPLGGHHRPDSEIQCRAGGIKGCRLVVHGWDSMSGKHFTRYLHASSLTRA